MNRKTALIAIAGSLAALGILAALVSPSGGNVRSVECIAQSTDRYTEADILAAFNAIETKLRRNSRDARSMRSAMTAKSKPGTWTKCSSIGKKGKGDLIVVLSEFTTDWRATDEGFSPNDRYEGWQLVLTRPSQGAPWKVVDWGY